MKKPAILCCCDITGFFADDWVSAGYEAMLIDPQHLKTRKEDGFIKVAGTIIEAMPLIRQFVERFDVKLVAGFPPCTDVAVSGSRHFDSKLKNDALAWAKAAMVAEQCRMIGEMIGCPWFFENPVSIFANADLFGKPSYFHPSDYGGYLPDTDRHPLYPDIINDRDAYTKKTGLWTGCGYELPEFKPVTVPEGEEGKSKQYSKTGGKSERTKNIRSATPRGFAKANFIKYCVDSVKEKA